MICRRAVLGSAALILTSPLTAAPLYLPPGSNLTFGQVTHTQRQMSAGNNPAAAAAIVDGRGLAGRSDRRGGLASSFSLGLEYGNVQELFDTIDDLARSYAPSEPDSGGGGPGQDPGDKPSDGPDLGEIIDIAFPDLRPALERAAERFATQVALLGLIRNEGYARAFIAADVPVLIGREFVGGNWTFGLRWAGSTRSFGITDDSFEFELESARADLEQQLMDAGLQPGDLAERFDVVGDIDFTIDPTSGVVRYLFDNDSLLLSKATTQTELEFGYSRQLMETTRGGLYVGAKAKLHDVKLSRYSVRFGDITDSEELFDEIRNADFRSDTGLGLDIGVLWVGNRYQLGATLADLNEPDFNYPGVDLTPYSDPVIIDRLIADQTFTMERQLKLEGALFTENGRWAVNFGIDANEITDPVGDDYQWATVSGGWTTGTNWAPNVRFGYRHNLAGTEVSYVSAGLQVFRFFNIDIASSLDTVKIGDDELPRGFMMNMGLVFNF